MPSKDKTPIERLREHLHRLRDLYTTRKSAEGQVSVNLAIECCDELEAEMNE